MQLWTLYAVYGYLALVAIAAVAAVVITDKKRSRKGGARRQERPA